MARCRCPFHLVRAPKPAAGRLDARLKLQAAQICQCQCFVRADKLLQGNCLRKQRPNGKQLVSWQVDCTASHACNRCCSTAYSEFPLRIVCVFFLKDVSHTVRVGNVSIERQAEASY